MSEVALFGKELWLNFISQLTYVSERDRAELSLMSEPQLRLIEELLHRAHVARSCRK